MKPDVEIPLNTPQQTPVHVNRQALRIGRFFMAVSSAIAFSGLMTTLYLLGLIEIRIMLSAMTIIGIAIIALYLTFRSGLNQRMGDPSLTALQMTVAVCILLYIMYESDTARDTFPILLGLILLFGVFRYSTTTLLRIAAGFLLAYAVMLGLVWHYKPGVDNHALDLVRWLVSLTVLPLFAWIGGHINKFRTRLQERRVFYQTIWEACPDVVIIVDTQDYIRYVNPAMSTVFGYEAQQIIGSQLSVLQAPATPTGHGLLAMVGVQRGLDTAATREIMGLHRDGRQVPIEATFNTVTLEGVSVVIGFLRDISVRKEVECTLSASEERFRRLTALSSDWYWEQDENFRFTMVSSGFEERTGTPTSVLIGTRRWDEHKGTQLADWDAHRATLEAHLAFTELEYQVIYDDGSEQWFSVDGEPLFDQGVFKGYYGTARDISDRKRAEARIRYMAQHDALTGLPNRLMLNDRLNHAIAGAIRRHDSLWVVFLDIDRFKLVNDSLGHKAGDVLLKTVSERLESVRRDTDTVARLGGDEFVLILPDRPEGSLAVGIIQRIMDVIAKPLFTEGHELLLTCSIGIAVYPTDGADAETLVEHADIAMYRAKEGGRNNFCFYTAAMNQHALQRLRMEGELRNALESEEFILHYQPQVDLRSGKIVGVEALLRWQHPTQGLVPPVQFISLIEEMGLIVPIGAWVLRTACAQARAWQQAGFPDLRIAVNLSARQFVQKDLVASISAILADTRLDAAYLEIEITESLVMTDVDHAIGMLRDLNALGVQLSIDDFGTGYSSLSYLKRFPIDVLKIDKSFVQDITHDPDDAAIVAAIISLAHNLGLTVTAEGVEEQSQLDYLGRCGCDTMQGYLFSMPVTPEALVQLLREEKTLDMAAA